MAWRDHKRKMRRDVHREMGVPALLLGRIGATISTPITIQGPLNKREMKMVGDLEAGNGWSQREDTQPRLLFDRLELESKNLKLFAGVIISVETGEAYRIGVARPRDDEWIVADVIPLEDDEAADLPVPEVAQ